MQVLHTYAVHLYIQRQLVVAAIPTRAKYHTAQRKKWKLVLGRLLLTPDSPSRSLIGYMIVCKGKLYNASG